MDSFRRVFEEHQQSFLNFRHQQHQAPELSGNERATAQRLLKFLAPYLPETVLENVGGTGLALIYPGLESGPTVLIRAELDAVPVQEENEEITYASNAEGVSHACGHDGHMTMVAALAPWLHAHPPKRGRVVLLFQPAEETGAGGKAVIEDPRWLEIQPDYAFALHNVPGLEFGELAIRNGTFCCASTGLAIYLKGRNSHAAHPEDGLSPADAMCELIDQIGALSRPNDPILRLATIIHAKLGEEAFGTAPGEAVVMATLRAASQEAMDDLRCQARQRAIQISKEHQLESYIDWPDPFPLNANHEEAVEIVRDAAQSCNYTCHQLAHPFRWSEDFGWISATCKGAMFALGSGVGQPQLHSPNFDFPDQLLEYGVSTFASCIVALLY